MNKTLSGSPFRGPHEGKELELMKCKIKPLSMFVVPAGHDLVLYPELEFDDLCRKGFILKKVYMQKLRLRNGHEAEVRRVLYALPGEEWRIPAMVLVQALYASLHDGWHPDLERYIGALLGYDADDVEAFISSVCGEGAQVEGE